MANIFINYRRADSITVAFILYNKLREKKHTVFIDKEAIPIGFDFAEYIKKKIKAYDVMLTLIGNQWLTIADNKNRIRIRNEDDHVRLELAEALQCKTIKIIPVLIDKVQMPDAKSLTADLKELTKLNAIDFFSYEYEKSADRVLSEIERTLSLLTSKDLSRFIKVISIQDDRIVAHALTIAMEGNLLAMGGIDAVIDLHKLDDDILYVSKLKKGQGAYILSGLYAAEQFGVRFKKWKVKAKNDLPEKQKYDAVVSSGTLKRYPVDSMDDMIRHLNSNRPVLASITVYEDFLDNKNIAKDGLILSPFKATDVMVGGHVVIITHVDLVKDRIKFAMSWGKQWGDKGFGYFSEASFNSCTNWGNVYAIETVY